MAAPLAASHQPLTAAATTATTAAAAGSASARAHTHTHRYGESADVYSFAMVMYECLSGKEPFADVQSLQLAGKVIEGKRPDIPATPYKNYVDVMEKWCVGASVGVRSAHVSRRVARSYRRVAQLGRQSAR